MSRIEAPLALAVEHIVRERLDREPGIVALCDAIYASWLSGAHPDRDWAPLLAQLMASRRLSGPGEHISVHNLAYAFGALMLAEHPPLHFDHDFGLRGVIGPKQVPLFPRLHAHNAWRVSHWIGGVPVLARAIAVQDQGIRPARVLSAAIGRIDRETGLLRTWRSDPLQRLFRRLYRMRHDPDLADLGGIVHLIWAQTRAGRPIVATENLHRLTVAALLKTGPFAESVPYCLDFDLLYLLRVCKGELDFDTTERVIEFYTATCEFLAADPPLSYGLHRLPGALAALHEAAQLVPELKSRLRTDLCADGPRDVIAVAGWL